MQPKIKTLFFDFDGLILETEGPIYQSWLELYQEYQSDLPLSKWVGIIGTSDHFDPLDELEKLVKQKLNRQTIAQRRRQRELELVQAQTVQPGIVDYLQTGQRLGLQLAVVSSSSRAWVSGHLRRLGLLEYFDIFRTRDDVRRTKPDPELYVSALKVCEVQPRQVIVFEDSKNGLDAAKAAGIYTVVVPNDLTRDMDFSQADLRLESFLDLPLEAVIAKAEES